MVKVAPVSAHRSSLGEGPLWDSETDRLYWVDSLGPRLHRLDHVSGEVETWSLPAKTIGSVAVREKGGLILAMDQGFYAFDPDKNRLDLIAEPLAGRSGIRFNDGKVDPKGAFIAGGMNHSHEDHEDCPAFRLNPDLSVEEIMSGFDVFNGPCFNGVGDRMYFTGRGENLIEVVDYESSIPLPEAHPFYEDGIPDGATVDAEDRIWTAQWTGSCLLRLSPEGKVEARIDLGDQIVTSVMFGGPNLDLLYVTTVGAAIREVTLKSDQAGMTLVVEGLGITGRPEPVFMG